jgi:hypothetical protein
MPKTRVSPALAALVLLGLFAGGCGMPARLHAQRMESLCARGTLETASCDLADELLDAEGRPKESADTARLLELGALFSEVGRYGESNEVLESVYRRYVASEEGPVISLRSTGASLAEATIAAGVSEYEPADFEKIYLHAIKARNYLLLGDREGAAVESRRAYRIERALRDRVDERKEKAASSSLPDGRLEEKTRLSPETQRRLSSISSQYENPFAMVLSSAIHLLRGERDDALIEARRAAGVTPSGEVKKLLAALEGEGELPNLFVFVETDRAPTKFSIDVRIVNYAANSIQKISFPKYNPSEKRVYNVYAGGAELEPIADVELLALKEYEATLPWEILKTMTRAISHSAKDAALAREMKGFGGLIGTITTELLEGADTRSWTLLPQMVYFGAVKTEGPEILVAVNGRDGPRTMTAAVEGGKINFVFISANRQGTRLHQVSFEP